MIFLLAGFHQNTAALAAPLIPYSGDEALSGDMQSGTDRLLLSGDMQSGTDHIVLSGNE